MTHHKNKKVILQREDNGKLSLTFISKGAIKSYTINWSGVFVLLSLISVVAVIIGGYAIL